MVPQSPSSENFLITAVYLRRVCSQIVLVELLGVNPVTIGRAIKETGP
jgi:hypothetical protein